MNIRFLMCGFFAIFLMVECHVSRQMTSIKGSTSTEETAFQTSPDIAVEDIYYHISVLASDSLEGRAAGTLGEQKTIDYIGKTFSKYGLNYYIQPFTFAKRERTWYDCTLSFGQFKGEMNRDFAPRLAIDSCKVSGEAVFLGYGYQRTVNGTLVDDIKNVDVGNKWVMIFEGGTLDKIVPSANQSILLRYNIASAKGAIGVLAITIDSASNGQLVLGNVGDVMFTSAGFTIPMLRISGKTADSLLHYAESSTSEVLNNIEDKQWNIPVPVAVSATVNTKIDSISSNNIIATLEGVDPVLKEEYIIIGAHYDHLGTRTSPTLTGDSTIIYYGADDNASGTAGVMELAEKFVSAGNLKRSLMFVLFGAEEQGLRGSNYFCNNLPVSQDKIKMMINMDMIGRMDSLNNVNVYAEGANSELLKTVAGSYPDLKLTFESKLRTGSDHVPFANKKIPVSLFFTGFHNDYHTPSDTLNAINFEGQKQLLNMVYDYIVSIP